MEKVLDRFFSFAKDDSSISYTFISLAVAVYGGMAVDKPPQVIEQAFQQQWFRVLVLSLIAYGATKDHATAVMSAIGFIMVMNQLKNVNSF